MSNGDAEGRSRAGFRMFSGAPYFWIFLAAILVRFLYSYQSFANPLFNSALLDASMYEKWANEIAGGKWLWDRIGVHTPVYPYFLALLKLAFGPNRAVIRSVQILMGGWAAVLTGKTAERLWNRKVGLLTAALVGADWMLIIQDSEEYAETFAIFFQSLALWLLLCRNGRVLIYFAAGLAFALSAGARPNLLLCLPLFPLWIAWLFRLDFKALAARLASWSLGFALVFVPILLRNHYVSGAWILRSLSSWNFYAAVEPAFEGILHPKQGIQYDNYMRQPARQGLRSQAEIERYWSERTRQIVRERPGAAVVYLLKRCLVFLNRREWSQYDFDAEAYRAYSPLLSLPWPHAALLVPFGLAGLVVGSQGVKERRFLAAYTAAGAFSVVLLKASSRYRLPSIVLLCAFSAAAILLLIAQVRERRWKSFSWSMGWVTLFALLSWPDWLQLNQLQQSRHLFEVGLWKSQLGRWDEAEAAFRKSADRFPWDADSPYRLGLILFERGDERGARPWFDLALQREPEFAEALTYLARIDLNEGKTASADDRVARALRLYPDYETALLLQARIRQVQGRTEEEVAAYEKAIRDYDDPIVMINLGLRLEDLGRFEDAVKWYGRVIETDSYRAFDRARAGLLAGYLLARRADQPDRARELWLMVTKRFTSEPFFLPQALFLSRQIDEAEYQRRVERDPSPSAKEFLWFNLGLARRLSGDTVGARQAFERCLSFEDHQGRKVSGESLPRKWSDEELKRINANPGAK